MSLYKCSKCNMIIERDSNKEWVTSLCSETGQKVRLQILTSMK